MAQSNDIVIVSGARTPMGRYCGKLRGFTAQELGAIAGRAAIERSGLEAAEFDHCVFGNAQQTSGDALYGARHVGLRAGLAETTPALTVNRLCGSGMQAIITGAQMIQLGEARVVLAGGMEAMSQAPHVIRGMRWGVGLGEGKLEDSLMVALLLVSGVVSRRTLWNLELDSIEEGNIFARVRGGLRVRLRDGAPRRIRALELRLEMQ